MLCHLYVEKPLLKHIGEVIFKYDNPIVGDIILFNNEQYTVLKREFNTNLKKFKNKTYESSDMNLILKQETFIYNN